MRARASCCWMNAAASRLGWKVRLQQHPPAASPASMRRQSGFALGFARACLAGKLRNSRHLLLRAAREADDPIEGQTLSRAAADLAASLRRSPSPRIWTCCVAWKAMPRKIFCGHKPCAQTADQGAFAFTGRTRRPPLDPINALLSFLYSMLMNDCRSALESVGLDAQLGSCMWCARTAALALDLMEEFRPIWRIAWH